MLITVADQGRSLRELLERIQPKPYDPPPKRVFDAGYEIVCIDNHDVENCLTLHKTYVALYVSDYSVIVLNDMGTRRAVSKRRFVKAP